MYRVGDWIQSVSKINKHLMMIYRKNVNFQLEIYFVVEKQKLKKKQLCINLCLLYKKNIYKI